MADKCPLECQLELKHINDGLDGHGKTLYGNDGASGLVSCVKSKVSKKALMAWIGSVIGILAMFTVAGLTAWGNAKDERKDNKQSIAVIQSDVQNKFDSLEKSINEVKSRQIDPRELLKEIRNIILEKKKEPGQVE